MRKCKKIFYDDLEDLKEIIKVEKLYCLPILWSGLTEKEIDKVDMKYFIFPWKRNWDWYFTEKIHDNRCETLENIYFSKEILDNNQFEYVDCVPETEVYMFKEKLND